MLVSSVTVSAATFHVFGQNLRCGLVQTESAQNLSRGKSFPVATEL